MFERHSAGLRILHCGLRIRSTGCSGLVCAGAVAIACDLGGVRRKLTIERARLAPLATDALAAFSGITARLP